MITKSKNNIADNDRDGKNIIIFSSVKLRSTVKAIDSSIQNILQSTKLIPNKKISREITNDVKQLKEYNNRIKYDIAPNVINHM